ncbi:MAG: dienelactone hydrolase family protein [Nitrospirae bacterium]|nr:dienelactone hydrolase family protein [Nitrospirota bacterium]
MITERFERLVRIPTDSVTLEGMLVVPERAKGVVLFAHGSGSSRHSPRNNFVAKVLHEAGIGTLLIDLLTQPEDAVYKTRFDIHLLTDRLTAATKWLMGQPQTEGLKIGYFGASTGAAAALHAAAVLGPVIGAVVSRGGRPDMAGPVLDRVKTPALLIVGGNDDVVIELNQQAYALLRGKKELIIIPGATHLFEEPGTLEEVARLAAEWFKRHLRSGGA